ALLRAAAAEASAPHAVPVAVNADARSLGGATLAEAAAAALEATGCPPARLRIEIPEPLLAETNTAPLLALGLGIVADHYGSGAMSLRLLGAASLAAIKLDASLVREIGASRRRQALVRAIVAAAAARDIPVAACGIEVEAERSALAALGVSTGQGSLFAAVARAA
ncbi:MAG: EAL domain-containing protein, partial [Rhodospirillales bacterium]|nr:EAL domain-containing protein [Rhodospirillales bacterium]